VTPLSASGRLPPPATSSQSGWVTRGLAGGAMMMVFCAPTKGVDCRLVAVAAWLASPPPAAVGRQPEKIGATALAITIRDVTAISHPRPARCTKKGFATPLPPPPLLPPENTQTNRPLFYFGPCFCSLCLRERCSLASSFLWLSPLIFRSSREFVYHISKGENELEKLTWKNRNDGTDL